MDTRAGELQTEYIRKARHTDQTYCGTEEGDIGPVESKLISMGAVRGAVFGAFGECSESIHELLQQLAVSRARVAEPQRGRSGKPRTEAAEVALNISFLRRNLLSGCCKGPGLLSIGKAGNPRVRGDSSSQEEAVCSPAGAAVECPSEGTCRQCNAGEEPPEEGALQTGVGVRHCLCKSAF